MNKYLKAVAAVVATVAAALSGVLTDSVITAPEWINVAILGVGAAGVFTAPNVPGATYTKGILAVLTGVLVLLSSLITDGITSAEMFQLVVAGLGAVGVIAIPNVNETGTNISDVPVTQQ